MTRYRPPTQSRSPFIYLAGCGCISLVELFAIGLILALLNGGFNGQLDVSPRLTVDHAQQLKPGQKTADTDDPEESAEKRE